MPFRIGRTFEIESGHLLSKHPGKCRFPHGHSRKVEVVLVADALDDRDMVCDFKAVKRLLEDFLARWDHALAINAADPQAEFYRATYGDRIVTVAAADPTSEVMARAVFEETARRLAAAATAPDPTFPVRAAVRVERVRVTETSASWAEYSA
jgi:6-pyruvoyltetrahydropterin/6-carboxytetrahydropterin synthase